MELQALESEMVKLLGCMHDALDKQRWRRMPALHQRLMLLFTRYCEAGPDAAALSALKATLHKGYSEIVARRQARMALLQAQMETHRQTRDGMLAYSMVSLFSENK